MDTKRDKDFLEKYYRNMKNKKNILIVEEQVFSIIWFKKQLN